MTVPTIIANQSYVGDGVSTVFAIPFLFYATTDLLIQQTDTAGTVTTVTSGTIVGAGNASGGTLTLAAPLTLNYVLNIILNPPLTQQSHYVANTTFPSASVEQALDRNMQASQRLQYQINRTVRAPDADKDALLPLTAASTRVGKFLTFDSNGQPILSSGTGNDTALRTDLGNGATPLAASTGFNYKQTAAEAAALVTPTNFYVPHHLACGYVLPERYGGAADNSTLNDTAHANALKVAYQIGDGTVVYGEGSLGIWKFAAPVTIGAANQGRRVVGMGRPEWSFAAGIANTLDLVTISADLSSAYKDQPQFDNIQVQCNSGGRDGVVLTVGNRPLVRNLRIINAGRDGYVESVTGTNWIEKADVSVIVLTAGRNAFRQEILGTAGQNPYINEGTYFLEARGVSKITAGGAALKFTGSAGLGGAAKLSDNFYRTIFDAIYNTAALVPSTSPVVLDTVIVQNPTFMMPAWENTGTGGNPGAGALIKVTSGSWGGLNLIAPNWNSLWGDGTIDAAIVAPYRQDYSFPNKNQIPGTLTIKGSADNQNVAVLSGNTTAGTAADLSITRTGAANASIGQNAGLLLGNSTSNTFAAIQEYNGTLIIFTFSGGSWGERARIKPDGSLSAIQIGGLSSLYSVTGGAPSGGTGSNGDFAFRQDGGAGTSIYMKRAGAWVGIV